jgi:hypothetical protein
MAKIEFKRGDQNIHQFVIPVGQWSAGGTLFFTAKPDVDDDITDANAVINYAFTDADMVNDGTNVTYNCVFPPSATTNIASDGEKKRDYLAEFQFVSLSGVPTTYPGDDNFLDAIVYFDLRRAVV